MSEKDGSWIKLMPMSMRRVLRNGNNCYYEDEGKSFRYCDTDELMDIENPRPCQTCKLPFTKKCENGAFIDPCIGFIKGVKNACCGHYKEKGYLSLIRSDGMLERIEELGIDSSIHLNKDYHTKESLICVYAKTEDIFKVIQILEK